MATDESRREFDTAELREGESPDTIGHAHANLQMLQMAVNEAIDVREEELQRATAGTLREVAEALADARETAAADHDSQLADLEDCARELAACIADGADADETAERMHVEAHQ